MYVCKIKFRPHWRFNYSYVFTRHLAVVCNGKNRTHACITNKAFASKHTKEHKCPSHATSPSPQSSIQVPKWATLWIVNLWCIPAQSNSSPAPPNLASQTPLHLAVHLHPVQQPPAARSRSSASERDSEWQRQSQVTRERRGTNTTRTLSLSLPSLNPKS